MITDWRFTSDVVLMFESASDENKVYIASPEKKQYEVIVSKLSSNIYRRETLENSDFEIKIGRMYKGCPRIYIKTTQLPTLDWTVVANFYDLSMWNIISQCNIKKGEVKGKFKIAFSESDPKAVSLISPDMIEYNEAQEEMKRRLRCDIGKKTKLLKPGHRYDLPKETRYYLCPIVSRKSNQCASDFQDDKLTLSTSGYIYTNVILESDHSISDVLRSRKIGTEPSDLKVAISENTPWIDSGEVLWNDFSGNIKDYWESIVDNTSRANKIIVGDSDFTIHPDLSSILEILGCQSEVDLEYKISDSLSTKLKSIISELLEYNLLKFWKIRASKPELELSEKKSTEENAEILERLFYMSFEDRNINKFSYYQSLFGKLSIELNKMSEILITNFSESDLTDGFENYMKYKFYWSNKKSMYYSNSRPILDYVLLVDQENPSKIEDLFGKTELSKTLGDLYSYAISNFGEGIQEYKVIKTDRKSTDFSVFCRITLNDIIKFKKGVSGMSESLKNDIIINKFDNLTINCKLSDKI